MQNKTLEKWEEKTLNQICTIRAGNSAPREKLFENGKISFYTNGRYRKNSFW